MINMFEKYYKLIWEAFWETNFMVFASLILCLLIAIPCGFLLFSFRNKYLLENPLAYQILSIILNTVRSIPYLIFILMIIPVNRFIFGTGFGNLPAVLPLTLVSVSLYSRFVEQALLNVPDKIIDRAISMGTTKFQMIRYFLLPSIKVDLILSFTSVTISLLSYSTVMGVIGAGGLGDFAYTYGYQEYDYDVMYLLALIFIVYVYIIQNIGYFFANRVNKR
ncbi:MULTISPECIES: methionine ABC transporter permease [unclassified Gemella]|uniref:methionine ABC transporter permease n=1 Tax=unclassified Gemella TaxID=2624949 RepID=UPI0010736901|nr:MULTISPECIES: methionine ABC transporter permease [unclassified Gemella]MBF0710043.1 ABC transporter permease [Gemella sp. GL1.1]MBF0746122.1 ABC transporter permease [Gemella sp. 19428wG2_WT2a]NYS27387.1 ABC transporter permease [Gemella sp. GL1]TFU60411.1 ABC transporter permease [Gemella sp. WT2a]